MRRFRQIWSGLVEELFALLPTPKTTVSAPARKEKVGVIRQHMADSVLVLIDPVEEVSCDDLSLVDREPVAVRGKGALLFAAVKDARVTVRAYCLLEGACWRETDGIFEGLTPIDDAKVQSRGEPITAWR